MYFLYITVQYPFVWKIPSVLNKHTRLTPNVIFIKSLSSEDLPILVLIDIVDKYRRSCEGCSSKMTDEKAAIWERCVVTPRVAASAGQPRHVTMEIGVKLGAARGRRGASSVNLSRRAASVWGVSCSFYIAKLNSNRSTNFRKLPEIVLVCRDRARSFDDFADRWRIITRAINHNIQLASLKLKCI